MKPYTKPYTEYIQIAVDAAEAAVVAASPPTPVKVLVIAVPISTLREEVERQVVAALPHVHWPWPGYNEERSDG